MLGASLPSHIIHRMRQQQQQADNCQHQSGRPSPEPRPPLFSPDSVYGTPPSDQEGFNELRKRQEESSSGSSPRQDLVTQTSVYGTPPKDTVDWFATHRGRRLSNIKEDPVDSLRADSTERAKRQESISSVRKKPRVADCSAQTLSLEDISPHSPLPASSPKSVLAQNIKNRSPSPSPKLKIPANLGFEDSEKPAVGNSGKQSGSNSSGSSGFWSSGSTTSGSGRFTPAALDLMKKKKTRKESPPNPFFKNAHFMRSTLSSASSNGSLGVLDELPGKFEKGKSYRLSPQPLTLGSSLSSVDGSQSKRPTFQPKPSLAQDGSVTQSQTSLMARLQSQTSSSEDFHMAASAFKADGTPVEDQILAKMFYEGAKNKRKLFRRQSTVSSLNSISLEDRNPNSQSNQVLGGEQDKEDISQSDAGQRMRYRELFLSLEPKSHPGSDDVSTFHSFSTSSVSERFHSTTSDQVDAIFDPEVMDLSEFDGADESVEGSTSSPGLKEMDNLSSVKVTFRPSPALQHQVSVENTDVWFDAKPCLS